MCVGDLGVVVAVDRAAGTARIATERMHREVSLVLRPQATVGDHVLVHTGFVIEVLEDEHVCTCTPQPGPTVAHPSTGGTPA
jgi:hydrogenase assembly chaperone HypC/HupF